MCVLQENYRFKGHATEVIVPFDEKYLPKSPTLNQ